jgi:tetratricopeptide (TPR) repeat protein/O-antigen ligase
MKSMTVRICDTVIHAGLPLIGTAIALALCMHSYDPLFIKTTILQTGTFIVFAAWAIKRIEGGTRFDRGALAYIVPAAAMFVSAAVSALFFSLSFDASFEELGKRTCYFLLLLTAVTEYRDIAKARYFFVWLMAVGLAVSVFGLFQHFGIDPYKFAESQLWRVPSTFGNPNFYGGFLVVIIPVLLSFFDFRDPAARRRLLPCIGVSLIGAVVYFLCTLTVASTGLRLAVFAALLAAVVAECFGRKAGRHTVNVVILFLLFCNAFLTASRSAQIGLAAGLGGLLVLALFFVLRMPLWKKSAVTAAFVILAGAGTLAGVVHFSRERELSVPTRKYYIRGALELIGKKPLLGHGLGTFYITYPLVKPRESWAFNEVCFQHVSNVYNEHLEILHDEGIIGFAFWAWFLAAVFAGGAAALRRLSGRRPLPEDAPYENGRFPASLYCPPAPVFLAGLLAGLFALLVNNIFSLSMRYVSAGFFFWLFCGIAAAQARAVSDGQASDPSPAVTGPRRASARRILQAAVIALAAAAIVFSWRLFAADLHLAQAVGHSRRAHVPASASGEVFHDIYIEGTRYLSDTREWELAIKEYLASLRLNPFNLRCRYFLANAFNRRWNRDMIYNPQWGDQGGKTRTDIERALEQYDRVQRNAPHYIEIDFELGDLYLKLGRNGKAVACYEDYKKYKPYFTKIHYALARAYYGAKEWEKAEEAYQDAIELNKRFTQAFIELSTVYHMLGQQELAEEFYRKALEVSPAITDKKIAEAYSGLGEYEKAVLYAERAAQLDSSSAEGFFRLGWLYIQLGQFDKAIGANEKAVGLDSTHAIAWINLSNLYFQKGLAERARAAYEKAAQIDPELVESVLREHGRGR